MTTGPDGRAATADGWAPLARELARKTIDLSAEALKVTHRRKDPIATQWSDRVAAARQREKEERRRRADERRAAQWPGDPLIFYYPPLAERPASRRPKAERATAAERPTRERRRWVLWFQVVLVVALLSIPALAVEPAEMLDDPQLELRAREIGRELRCLVCQNQSIDDSNAGLARDLRVLVRDRLLEGDTNQEVLAYVTDRYGDYVLLRPPFQSNTLVLWLAPAVLLGVGTVAVGVWYRARHRVVADPATLSAEEQQRLSALVGLAPRSEA